MPLDDFDTEGQPNGVHIEKTLDVVDQVLSNLEFAEEVAAHNKWFIPAGENFQQGVALRFLTARYQWTVSLLSAQTETLNTRLGTALSDLEELRWSVQALADQVAQATWERE